MTIEKENKRTDQGKKIQPEKFSELLSRASDGDPDARVELGICYEEGIGVEKNIELAKILYWSVIEAEDAKAGPYLAADSRLKAQTGENEDGFDPEMDYPNLKEDIQLRQTTPAKTLFFQSSSVASASSSSTSINIKTEEPGPEKIEQTPKPTFG